MRVLPLFFVSLTLTLVSCSGSRGFASRQQPPAPVVAEVPDAAPAPVPVAANLSQLPTLDSRQNPVSMETLNWQTLAPVYFSPGGSALAKSQLPALQAAVDLLKNRGVRVVLAGHTSALGSSEYNRSLGQLRAGQVKKALVSEGIPANAIDTVSYGQDRPAADQKHDRVEFGLPAGEVALR